MHDKFEMLDGIIVAADKLSDARGVEKCKLIIEIIQRAAALEEGLKKDDETHKAEIASLESEVSRLTHPAEAKAGEQTIGGQVLHIDLEGGTVNVSADAQ